MNFTLSKQVTDQVLSNVEELSSNNEPGDFSRNKTQDFISDSDASVKQTDPDLELKGRELTSQILHQRLEEQKNARNTDHYEPALPDAFELAALSETHHAQKHRSEHNPSDHAPEFDHFEFFEEDENNITNLEMRLNGLFNEDFYSSSEALLSTDKSPYELTDDANNNHFALYTYDVGIQGRPSNFRFLKTGTDLENSTIHDGFNMTDGKPNLLLLTRVVSGLNTDSQLLYQKGALLVDGKIFEGRGYFSHDSRLNFGVISHGDTTPQLKYDEQTGAVTVEKDSHQSNGDSDQETAPESREQSTIVIPVAEFEALETTIAPIGEMANDMAAMVQEADADFMTAIVNLDIGSFKERIAAQASAANLIAVVSGATGALGSLTSAVSSSAGKIGQ